MTEPSVKKARVLIVDDGVANIARLTSIAGRIGYDTIKSLTCWANQSLKKSGGQLSPNFSWHDRGSCSVAVTSGGA
jgi:hypothetical protein